MTLIINRQHDKADDAADDEQHDCPADIDVEASANDDGEEGENGKCHQAPATPFGKSSTFIAHAGIVRDGLTIPKNRTVRAEKTHPRAFEPLNH